MITRAQWGARPPRNVSRMGAVLGYAGHWEGVALGVFGHEKCAAKIRGIQNYHMDVNKWADIAYNYILCPHGEIFEGRGLNRSAANGTNDANDHYLAVCYLGGPGDPFTDAAKLAFKQLVGSSKVYPHSKFFNTACPGPVITTWIASGMPVKHQQAPKPPVAVHVPPVHGPVYDIGDNVKRKVITIAKGEHRGWFDTQVPFDKFVNAFPQGPNPERDDYVWSNPYYSVNNHEGQARIVVEENDPPRELHFVVLWTE